MYTFPNTSSSSQKPLRVVFSTLFSVFGNVVKHGHSCLTYYMKHKLEYFRCPTIAKARAILHNNLSESPQLLVIYTGTNDLTLTIPTDKFISELSSFITETATKFPKSKLSSRIHHKHQDQQSGTRERDQPFQNADDRQKDTCTVQNYLENLIIHCISFLRFMKSFL